MATFKYISKDMSAKTIRGTLEADDRNDLVRKLKEQNLFLVSCQDVTKKTVNQYKMKLNELSAYSREIGTMLASGLSLIRIFSIMVRREDNKKIKKIYENIYVKLQQGYTLLPWNWLDGIGKSVEYGLLRYSCSTNITIFGSFC